MWLGKSAIYKQFTFFGCIALVVSGCGGAPKPKVVDESEDMLIGESGTSSVLDGTEVVGMELAGSAWKWTGALCTEGVPTLPGDFARTTAISSDEKGLLFTHEDFSEGCVQTLIQRAEQSGSHWKVREDVRVAAPECKVSYETERPADFRIRDNNLEVYVQRSRYCNGLELRMVYEAVAPNKDVPVDVLTRHYVAHFNRKDSKRLAALFDKTGAMVDMFRLDALGSAQRVVGRDNVQAWYEKVFREVPWLALRWIGVEEGLNPGEYTFSWEYIDPRLDQPFAGHTRMIAANGQILESWMEVTKAAVDVPVNTPAKSEGEGTKSVDAPSAETQPAKADSTKKTKAETATAKPTKTTGAKPSSATSAEKKTQP